MKQGPLFLSILLLSVLGGLMPARAEDANSLLRRGIELRKQGKDREALEVFERAVQIEKTPRALAQLGLSEQALGSWPKAEEHIQAALQDKDDPWIKKNRAALENSLQTVEGRLGSLEVWGEPEGAEVQLNGHPVGTLPTTGRVRVETGQVTITVRAKGFIDMTRTIEVARGDELRESVALVAERRPEAAPRAGMLALAAPPDSTDAPRALVSQSADAAPETTPSRPIYARWWFWTAIVVVAGGAATAAVLLTRHHSSGCDANVSCGTL
jgi:tetratricopeptide (TPR) repeat protein